VPTGSSTATDDDLIGEAVREYACASIANDDERRKLLLNGRPTIPRETDVGLILAVSDRLGRSIRTDERVRRQARKEFWKVVAEQREK